jgi:SET domain-containing protein
MADRVNYEPRLKPPPDPGPNPWLEIRRSPIHGTGGFARQPIPKGTRVVEYVGEKISKSESLRRCLASNHYIFTLTEEFDLDGDVPWNPARFLNHSCRPNCEAEKTQERIWIIALRDIAAGEELTFNYGYDLEEYRDHPCRCGAPDCVGYIVAEEFFEHVRRQNRLAQS